MLTLIYLFIALCFFIVCCKFAGKIIKRDYSYMNTSPDMLDYIIGVLVSILLGLVWPITIIVVIGLGLTGYRGE